MKVERQPTQANAQLWKQGMDLAKSSSFQQVLKEQAATKRTQDTISIYSKGSQDAVGAAATQSTTVILPTDSTEIKLAKLQVIAEKADYTGMSYKDIYKTIWDRYNASFDGNMTAIDDSAFGGKEWCDISYQFYNETNKAVFLPIERECRLEQGLMGSEKLDPKYIHPTYRELSAYSLGYSGSMDEIEASIQARYAGKDSLQDFLNMQGELYRTGVLSEKLGTKGASEYQSILHTQLERTYKPEQYYYAEGYGVLPYKTIAKVTAGNMSKGEFNAVLSSKFEGRAFFSDMKHMVSNMTFSNFSYDVRGVLNTAMDGFLASLDGQEDSRRNFFL